LTLDNIFPKVDDEMPIPMSASVPSERVTFQESPPPEILIKYTERKINAIIIVEIKN
jgi:hypothetical protein